MDASELRRKQKELLFPNVGTYYQEPLVVESAKGMYVKDVEGISKGKWTKRASALV